MWFDQQLCRIAGILKMGQILFLEEFSLIMIIRSTSRKLFSTDSDHNERGCVEYRKHILKFFPV